MKFEKNTTFNLPVLVTRGLVLFPNQTENIYCERSFSVSAVSISKETYESYILVISQKNSEMDQVKNIDEIYKVGVLCHIEQINPIKRGFRIKVTCLERVMISNFLYLNDTIYCDANLFEDVEGDLTEEQTLVKNLFKTLESLDATLVFENGSKEVLSKFSSGMSAKNISYLLSSSIQAYPEEKQELLEAKNINERLLKLIVLCDKLVKNVQLEKKIQDEKVFNSFECSSCNLCSRFM